MTDNIRIEVHKAPVLDTGLGREAGYENDEQLIEAGRAQRAELEGLLTPEALTRLDAAEEAVTQAFLFGPPQGAVSSRDTTGHCPCPDSPQEHT